MSSKHIGHVWFNGRSNIGIVLGHDPIQNKLKAWITTVVGMDEEDDIQHIMEWGSKFPVQEAITLIRKHGTMKISQEEMAELILNDGKVGTSSEKSED